MASKIETHDWFCGPETLNAAMLAQARQDNPGAHEATLRSFLDCISPYGGQGCVIITDVDDPASGGQIKDLATDRSMPKFVFISNHTIPELYPGDPLFLERRFELTTFSIHQDMPDTAVPSPDAVFSEGAGPQDAVPSPDAVSSMLKNIKACWAFLQRQGVVAKDVQCDVNSAYYDDISLGAFGRPDDHGIACGWAHIGSAKVIFDDSLTVLSYRLTCDSIRCNKPLHGHEASGPGNVQKLLDHILDSAAA